MKSLNAVRLSVCVLSAVLLSACGNENNLDDKAEVDRLSSSTSGTEGGGGQTTDYAGSQYQDPTFPNSTSSNDPSGSNAAAGNGTGTGGNNTGTASGNNTGTGSNGGGTIGPNGGMTNTNGGGTNTSSNGGNSNAGTTNGGGTNSVNVGTSTNMTNGGTNTANGGGSNNGTVDTSDTGLAFPPADWGLSDHEICEQAQLTAGYLDQYQTAGDGKVVYCHDANGNGNWILLDTANSACFPHLDHAADVLPLTGCDT